MQESASNKWTPRRFGFFLLAALIVSIFGVFDGTLLHLDGAHRQVTFFAGLMLFGDLGLIYSALSRKGWRWLAGNSGSKEDDVVDGPTD